MDKYALIKKNADEIVIASFQNLDKYDLECGKIDYKERELYVHKQKIGPNINLFELLYKLTKSLTQERQTLDFVISNVSQTVEIQDQYDWIDKNVPLGLESAQHVEKYWKQYCQQTGNDIQLLTWMKSFNKLYSEHAQNGCFYRNSTTVDYDMYVDSILRPPAEMYSCEKTFVQPNLADE